MPAGAATTGGGYNGGGGYGDPPPGPDDERPPVFVVSGTSGSYPWSVAVAAGSGSEAALAVADQFDGDTRQIRVTDRQISEIADALTAEGGLSGADLLSCRGLAAREIVAVADWAETRA